MDPQGPSTPTTNATTPTPIAVNPLNNRPIFLNTLPPLTEVRGPATPAAPSPPTNSLGPATPAKTSAPPSTTKISSYALHLGGCTENCSSAISWTLVVAALFIASGIFMFLHRKKRVREYREEEPVMSVATKFNAPTPGIRDVRSPFEPNAAGGGFNSFDGYNQNYDQRAANTDSYYESDYVEGYVGVAGFGAGAKDQRQSQHAGIGGFGVNRSQEPMPPMPALNVPPPPMVMPTPEEQAVYDQGFADYQDEWERYQQEEASATGSATGHIQQPAYRGGHDSTVEGHYFSPQDYADDTPQQQPAYGHDVDIDEDHAFEPSPYFAAQDEEDEPAYALPMPQFEVEDYYVRDHLATDPVAPTANAPVQINWMSEEEKSYWDNYKK